MLKESTFRICTKTIILFDTMQQFIGNQIKKIIGIHPDFTFKIVAAATCVFK